MTAVFLWARQLQAIAQSGLTYTIQRSSTVDGTYTAIDTVTGDGSEMSYIDTSVSDSAFYQVVASE